jgi:hypothetical protein
VVSEYAIYMVVSCQLSSVCVNVLLSYGLKWHMVLDLKYTSESHGAELWMSLWVTW